MPVKKILVTVIGGTVLLIGIALLVLPGPAFVVIPLGLAILASEYVWARRWLKRAKNMTNKRKAKRTTRVLRQAFERRWTSLRARLARWIPWLAPASPVDPEPAGEPVQAAPSSEPAEDHGSSDPEEKARPESRPGSAEAKEPAGTEPGAASP